MKQTKTYFAALIITTAVLMNVSTGFAQEWRMLLGQGILQNNPISPAMDKESIAKNNWLATQTPLLKNRAITSVAPSPRTVEGVTFDSEYSQVGSWVPLPSPTGQESFTLFSF